MQSYSLFELNEYVRRVVALNFAEAIWIKAEIAQLNNSNGHIFMDLVQKSDHTDELIARAESVIWAKSVRKIAKQSKLNLDRVLLEGNEVLLKAQVDFHERYGLKLVVEEIDGDFTLGKLLAKRAEALEKLRSEQLLLKNPSLDLPLVIQRVAVISSANAAGLQDYLHQMASNPYGYQIFNHLFAATVQGDRAATNVIRQLETISNMGTYDCIAIIRGGGARMDLSAFDDYSLGKAIANSPIPVITGIGHDVDETVADKVAHTELKTPTAVAEFIVQHNTYYEAQMEQLALAIKDKANIQTQYVQLALGQLQQRIAFLATQRWQTALRQVETTSQSLLHATKHYLLKKASQLSEADNLLKTYDVNLVLEKGFAFVTKDGAIVNSITDLNKDDVLNIQFKDGNVGVNVEQIKPK